MREQLGHTRKELAQTIKAMADRNDLTAQTRHKLANVRVQAQKRTATARARSHAAMSKLPPPVREQSSRILIGAAVAAVVGWLIRRHREP